MGTINKEVAECVGLWLAEGDNKSARELTFTNNCWELIEFFNTNMKKLFREFKYNKRIYVYTPDGSRPEIQLKDCQINYYTHKRATKPYFIFKIASVEIVESLLNKNEFYPSILRGFFAGEGNIHEGKRSVRVIRISQKERKKFIDEILDSLSLKYNFTKNNRMYNLSNKRNWDIFAKHKLANLHPKKKDKFWRLYNSYKQEHYDKFYLKNKILELSKDPLTTKLLSSTLNRSEARICEVLIDLKKENKIKNYRVGSVSYWISDKDLIIISKLKKDYLLFSDRPKQTSEFAKKFNVSWKSSFKRLKELEKLNLVIIDNTGKWIKTQKPKAILAI